MKEDSAAFSTVEILNAIDVSIVVVARDFTIARFNRSAAEALSLTTSNIGRSVHDVAALTSLRNLEKWCADVVSTQTTSRHDFRNKDKTFVLRIAPYSEARNRASGAVLTFTNVTGFRASLDQAIYEREYTKAILNAGADPLVVLNRELSLQTANRAFYQMFGVSREAVQNVPLDALENGTSDIARIRTELEKMLFDGGEFTPVEVEHDFPAIGRRTLVLDARPLSLSGGSRPMILLSFHDVTMRKQAEEALRAADRAKDEFLAMVGHELRNPLGALASATRILDLKNPSSNQMTRARAVIDRQIDQLSHLVDDLLDASRLTSAKMRLIRRPLDLSQVVKETIELLRARGLLDRHQLSFAGTPVWIHADETRIEQIVTNLVGNALKFTPTGGTITVSVHGDGARASLVVKDTGVGIPADVLPVIFDLFVQGERSLDRSQGGLGIGLTVVRRLVELHDGTVQADSDGPGTGSTFTVHLPAVSAPKGTAGEQTPIVAAPSEPRRVLVVEDNEDLREMLGILLEQDGHEVELANDGPSGLEAALNFRPDVGLLDLGLPGFDGYALARQIRAHDGGDQIYLVALTGYGQPEDRLRSKEAGFDAVVVKPLGVNQLSLLLQRANRL